MSGRTWKLCAGTVEKCAASDRLFLSACEPARAFLIYCNGCDNSSNHGRRLRNASGIFPLVIGHSIGRADRRRSPGIGGQLGRNPTLPMLSADSFASPAAVSIWSRKTILALLAQSDRGSHGWRCPVNSHPRGSGQSGGGGGAI